MTETPTEIIAALLREASINSADFSVAPGEKGGNNRIDVVSLDDKKYMVKWYFRSDWDLRDRLESEWSFLHYASEVAPAFVPKPLARLSRHNVALYEFIDGCKLDVQEIGLDQVCNAARFLKKLNSGHLAEHKSQLRDASEAFFAVSGHVQHIDKRLDRLVAASIEQKGLQNDFFAFVQHLVRFQEDLKSWISSETERAGIDPDLVISESERIISPSDFGFHNVLVTDGHNPVFIDFEYAGLDDPAKTLADFFLQPAIPVNQEYYSEFAHVAFGEMSWFGKVVKRAAILRPLLALKWCCIMLNPFVPEWAARSQFANSKARMADLKSARLVNAKKAFSGIEQMLTPITDQVELNGLH